ncbi:TPA: hypothetical protein QB482_000066 [Pasteurella multocida]|uniref:hypothetical protein n=1 Tax=Pasteurella multocida TaxID=747 RepID=UPI00145A4D43|nr:hypothetical protein [Pasteurella multocida]NMK15069.1 hypothetical protein [Pasteurella multocida]URH76987.1 hypothetical protein M8993_04950 [Pasteurella multocida]URH90920.1 hypothetical protein M8849_04950 [Pasteurella multocida]URJ97952.1 hypothetical protein M9413_03655 [Pasteurella multocida]HDR1002510.1 hypothetical protein [Pasteurella multocida]
MAEENEEKGNGYILWFILFLVAVYLFITIQEMRGYCFDKWEYIHNLYTEQELIDRGVEYVVSTMPSGVFEPDGTTTEIKRYASVEEFKQMNPDCCKLTRFINEGIDGYPDDDGYGYIRIEYLRHYVGNFKPDHRVLYLEYTPCGELREEVSF